jgi:NAD(P)-dependent dehydrogenase (short-subunit alcohol dehydrogenase family)
VFRCDAALRERADGNFIRVPVLVHEDTDRVGDERDFGAVNRLRVHAQTFGTPLMNSIIQFRTANSATPWTDEYLREMAALNSEITACASTANALPEILADGWHVLSTFGEFPSPDGRYVQVFGRAQADAMVRSWNSIAGRSFRWLKNVRHRLKPSLSMPVFDAPPGAAHPDLDPADWSKLPIVGEVTELRASNTALEGFVKSLAKEIGGKGATANLVVDAGGSVEGAAAFFASRKSAFITGQVVVADAVVEGSWERPLEGKVAIVTGAARGIGGRKRELARNWALLGEAQIDAGGECPRAVLARQDAAAPGGQKALRATARFSSFTAW